MNRRQFLFGAAAAILTVSAPAALLKTEPSAPVFNVEVFRRASKKLKEANAKPRIYGDYLVLIHPDMEQEVLKQLGVKRLPPHIRVSGWIS